MNLSIEALIVDNDTCNDTSVTVLDLSSFIYLKVFEVGDYSFTCMNQLKMMGLNQLERVVIGRKCFTYNYGWGNDPNRHFYLKNCKRLRELKIGRFSFSDYSVCEIANVPSLEVIEMGELSRESGSFFGASLELKSKVDEMRL